MRYASNERANDVRESVLFGRYEAAMSMSVPFYFHEYESEMYMGKRAVKLRVFMSAVRYAYVQ